MMPEPIVIGLGGNVGSEAAITGRFQRVRAALAALGELRAAGLYRSSALGPAQPPYLNSAVQLVLPDVQPAELSAVIHELESLLGRDRAQETRWGPRPIDLDVLVWGARVLRTPTLDVPHPRLHDRRFALAPLVELLGEDFTIPNVGRAGDALAKLGDQVCALVAAAW